MSHAEYSGVGVVLVPSFKPPKTLHQDQLSQHDFIHSLLCLDPPRKPPPQLKYTINASMDNVHSEADDSKRNLSFVDNNDKFSSQAGTETNKRPIEVDLTNEHQSKKSTSSYNDYDLNLFGGALTYTVNTSAAKAGKEKAPLKHSEEEEVVDQWKPVEKKEFKSMNTSLMKPLNIATGTKKSAFGSLLKSSSKIMSLIDDDLNQPAHHVTSSSSMLQQKTSSATNPTITTSREVFPLFKESSKVMEKSTEATPIAPVEKSTEPLQNKTTKPLPSLRSLLSSTEASSSSSKVRDRVSQSVPVDARVSTFFADDQPRSHHFSSSDLHGRSSSQHLRDTTASFQIEDFKGIQQLCRNAGATKLGLQAFLKDCLPMEASSEEKTICVALLFQDLSSSHATFSIKYCTPTSTCYHWYCTCDRHVRAESIRKNLVGVLVLVPNSPSVHGKNAGQDHQAVCYFLPLTTCIEDHEEVSAVGHGLAPDYKADLKSLPMRSESTVSQRWEAFFQILYHPRVVKIFYHTQVALLPIIYAWNHNPSLQFDHVEIFPHLYDVKIAEYLLNSDMEEKDLELFALLDKYQVEVRSSASSETTGLIMGQVSRAIGKVKDELVALYTLHQRQSACIQQNQLSTLLHQIEIPTSCLLSAMELHGVHINLHQYETLRQDLQRKLQQYEEEVYKLSGFQFNVASPEQVAHVLYTKLQLAPSSAKAGQEQTTATASGKFLSTSEEALSKILHLHPVVQQILNYRSIMKLLSTYIEGIKPLLTALESRRGASNPFSQNSAKMTNRLHAYWNQTSTRTGRLSCCKPNLQNIPGNQTIDHTEYSMRALFVSSPNKIIVTADYSQIEMRILAHVSNDRTMCQLFQHDGDVYRILAGKIMNKPTNHVDDDERNRAKVICLGVLYGMGPQAAAARLNIDIPTASKITNSFFNNFPQVKAWIQRVKLLAKQHGHVKTIVGRIRQLPDINSSDAAKKGAAERQAVNSIIQGSASDLIKYAMIATVAEIKKFECTLDRKPWQLQNDVKLIMQIHDELIFEVPKEDLSLQNRLIQLIKDVMEKAICSKLNLRVPLIANISIGPSWGSTESWKPA